MDFFRTIIARPVMTTMIVVVLVVMGIYSYSHLITELIPRLNFPVVVVTTVYPGAAPGEVETQITKKIEDQVATLAGIEELTSTSMENMSQVIVQFALETDEDQDAIDVKDKVDAITGDLPEDAEDPIITKFDIAGEAVVELAVSGPRPLPEIFEIVDKTVKERLSRIDGVAEVEIIGTQERQIQVAVHPERLRAYGLTLTDVLGTLAATNLNVPVGHITRSESEINVRMLGEVGDPAELAGFRLNLPGGGTVPLGEVADILDTTEEVREASTWNGNAVITVAVQKRSDGNTITVADGVFASLDAIREAVGPDISIEVVKETASFVRDSRTDVLTNMAIGIALTGMLLFLFLHDWRPTLIAAVAMPVSVVAAFMLMEASGFTLNVMSLMALGISIGTLVTNSIIVLENISRLVGEGVEPKEAAARGTGEIAVAVLASTLTNVVVFTPIAFMSGLIGQFFRQFGLTVVYATLFSLVVSFTLVPMLAARMIRPGSGLGHGRDLLSRSIQAWERLYGKLERDYRTSLAWCLRWRRVTLLGTVAVFMLAMTLFGRIGGGFIPLVDSAKIQVSLELPAGTNLERTREVAGRLADDLRNLPEVAGVLVKVGGQQRGIEDADIFVRLVDKSERDATLLGVMNAIRPRLAGIPDAKVAVYPLGGGSYVEADLVLEVLGNDSEDVKTAGEMVYRVVRDVPGLVEVQSSDEPGKPEIKVVPRREQLADRGLMTRSVGGILRTAYEGQDAGVYRENGEEYDVVVKYAAENRGDPDYLPDLPVLTPAGATVPLAEVADLVPSVGEPTILHSEKQRVVNISANIATGSLSQNRRAIDAGVAELEIPDGVVVKYGGDAEMQDESFAAIFEALILAIVLIYIVMAALLESFIHPITVMVTLPLSLIGMAVSLFWSGEDINIMSLMALVMMVGIVVNNAILMLDYVGQLRARGMGIREALLEGCPTKLRAIVMANLAIAIGMIPQLVGAGAGSEFRAPMAVVQIGGVLISAIFTLFVVPVVYTYLDRLTLAGRKEASKAEA
ncbi:MAG: efflux RND transporter permease subunit [Candidatus Krumholzibacteriia bacterium]